MNVQIIVPPEREGVSFREVGFTIAEAFKKIKPDMNVVVDPWTKVFIPNITFNPMGFATWDLFIFPMTVAPNATTLFAYYASPLMAKRAWYYGVVEGKASLNSIHKEYLSNRVVTPSNFAKKCLEEIGVKVKGVIPHGFKVEDYIFNASLVRSIVERFKGKTLLYYLSSGIKRKGIEPLLEAMAIVKKHHPDIMLHLDVLPQYVEKHYAYAKKLGVEDVVAIDGDFGQMSKEQVVANYHAADLIPHACYSEDTRLVTANGIKNISEMKIGDMVWTLNDGTLQLNPIERIYSTYYEGEMIVFENKQVSLCVTPDHRVYYYTPKTRNKVQVKPAKDFVGKNTRYFLPVKGKWHGINKEYAKSSDFFEKAVYIKGYDEKYELAMKLRKEKKWGALRISKAINVPYGAVFGWLHLNKKPWGRHKNLPELVHIPSLLELIGWYIAEGSLSKGGSRNRELTLITIYNRSEKNKQRIAELLKKMGLHPIIYKDGVRTYCRPLAKKLAECGRNANEKTIPDWCLQFSSNLLKHLYDGLMNGNGNRSGHSIKYYTSSDKLKDKFVELCMKLGYTVKIRKRNFPQRTIGNHVLKASEGWVIFVREKHNQGTIKQEHVKKIRYKGLIWCVSTRNKNLFVERNGLICNCGNSLSEGFGMPIVEAQLCRKPVIVVDAEPMNEHVDESCGWLVPYDQVEWEDYLGIMLIKEHVYKPEAFAEAIIYALDHPKELEEKGVKAYLKAREKYDYVKCYRQFLTL